MEILSSGSFINLENQEKIEQLKYTARELANAAIETEGFVNEEEAGRKLALEFWQGLEYMCRESEQATIQNIFTGHFLECLRELRTFKIETNITATTNELPAVISQNELNKINSEDEFLGVLSSTDNHEMVVEEQENSVQEIPAQTEGFTAKDIYAVENVSVETPETVFSESEDEEPEISTVSESAEIEPSKAETQVEVKATIGSLNLPEKEPYQFDKCTVTATIQLLPTDENSNCRKAVLSVKTHDFAPQISMVEVSGSNLSLALAPEIEKVLAKYQADLPLKVMDKLKKEKSQTKKSTPKPTTETKSVSQSSPKTKEIPQTQTAPGSKVENSSPVVPPTAAETGVQGSLFGF